MINLNAFSKNHPHGEQNRSCVKDPELLARIDKVLASNKVDEKELEAIEHEIRFTNKCVVMRWLMADLESTEKLPAVKPSKKQEKKPKVEQKLEQPKQETSEIPEKLVGEDMNDNGWKIEKGKEGIAPEVEETKEEVTEEITPEVEETKEEVTEEITPEVEETKEKVTEEITPEVEETKEKVKETPAPKKSGRKKKSE